MEIRVSNVKECLFIFVVNSFRHILFSVFETITIYFQEVFCAAEFKSAKRFLKIENG